LKVSGLVSLDTVGFSIPVFFFFRSVVYGYIRHEIQEFVYMYDSLSLESDFGGERLCPDTSIPI